MTDNLNSFKNQSLKFNSARDFLPWLAVLSVIVLTAVQLFRQDRIWWCKFGDYAPWSSDAWGKHNSQHLFDPYSFTHVLHGVLYFWLTSLIFRKMPLAWRFFAAIFVECGWEILENTNSIIEHYRAATLALDYYGDSIANSLGDIFSCGVGFWLAYKLKFWRSLALFLLTEIVLLVWIHDSLLLNIIMLIHPIEAVKAWQNS
ncbi:MAG: DUF2585 family protein [Acidobacteriota bacterium]|nr:DUF2585 family protein [Acidobacteriota bacterium]